LKVRVLVEMASRAMYCENSNTFVKISSHTLEKSKEQGSSWGENGGRVGLVENMGGKLGEQ